MKPLNRRQIGDNIKSAVVVERLSYFGSAKCKDYRETNFMECPLLKRSNYCILSVFGGSTTGGLNVHLYVCACVLCVGVYLPVRATSM